MDFFVLSLSTHAALCKLLPQAWAVPLKLKSTPARLFSRESPAVKTSDEFNAAYRLPEKVQPSFLSI